MFAWLPLGYQGLNRREILTMQKSFPSVFSLRRRIKTTQVRIQAIHSVHPWFCIKCTEIVKQFRKLAQETTSGAVVTATGRRPVLLASIP